jgi:hypothetical protein
LKKFKDILKSRTGFSLMEVMIGGSILAGVALAGAQLYRNQRLAQKKLELEQKLSTFHMTVQKFMNSAAHCNATMTQVISAGSSLAANQTFSQLRGCQANCTDNEGSTGTNLARNAYSVVPNPTPFLSVGGFIDPQDRVWSVTRIQNIDGAVNSTRSVRLRVTYRMAQGTIPGAAKDVNKDIVVHLRFSGGVFQECIDAGEAVMSSVQQDLCQTINPNYNDGIQSNGEFTHWDDEKQLCIIGIKTPKDCPLGMAPDGVDSTGVVRCKNLTTPFDADSLVNPSADTCGAGQVPTLIYENKKLKVVCQ